jgi:hypothetical protein
MLPPVAVRQLVPRNARIVYAGDEAPPGNTLSAAAIDLASGRRPAERSPAAPVDLARF